MSDATIAAASEFRDWIRRLGAEPQTAEARRLGTLRHIDAAARLRGAQSVTTGEAVSLERPMVPYPVPDTFPGLPPGRPMFDHVARFDDAPHAPSKFYADGSWSIGNDHLELETHGTQTHVDGLSHIVVDGTAFGGQPFDDGEHSIAHFAEFGIFTRAVLADIPRARGVEWVDAEHPVGGEDLDSAMTLAGERFQAGDALLLYMGRHRFEESNAPTEFHDPYRSGIGMSGSEWIADNKVSVLCWDFSDANHPSQPRFAVHMLIWAVGLVIVDGCDYTVATDRLRQAERSVGALTLAPLRIPGTTGSPVNPLVIL